MSRRALVTGASVAAVMALSQTASADFVILDDLIVDGSACIGFDCVNGESFGFDTIRLKENNLRIKFEDTSSTASFPTTDWTLVANDSANGGQNKFSILDNSANRTIFTVEGNAPSNSLYVDDGGRIGFGTSIPVADLHVKTGNTPTLRLEQDGTSGFSPQTFDVAANEANFFVRDATNGSTLPFRIRPGADSNVIYIDPDSEVGINHTNPEAPLHIEGDMENDQPHMIIEATGDGGRAELWFEDANTTADDDALRLQLTEDVFNISFDNTGGPELRIRKAGDVEVLNGDLEVRNGNDLVVVGGGSVVVNGTTLNVPDYVFAPDYDLMPLAEVSAFIAANSHLPQVPSAAEINSGALNMTEMQLTLLKKVEELTLYTLDQEARIEALTDELKALRAAK